MKETKWSEILERNKDAIIDALIKSYTEACGAKRGNQFLQTEYVIVNRDGDVRISTMQSSNTPEDVWKGDAIFVGGCEWFDPWEDEENVPTILEDQLTAEEMKSFVEYLQARFDWVEGSTLADFENEYDISTVENWNPDVFERLDKEMKDAFICEYANQWAEETFERELHTQKENETFKS